MNVLLWILQGLAGLIYGASGFMKLFLFDAISADVPSFGALPRGVWMTLGAVELICVAGLLLPGILHRQTGLTVLAAAVLAAESLLFIWVHVRHGETGAIAMSAALGILMAFIAYGRAVLQPLG